MHNDTCLVMSLGRAVFFSSLLLFCFGNGQAFILLPDAVFNTRFGHFSGRHDDGDHRGFGGAKRWWGNGY